MTDQTNHFLDTAFARLLALLVALILLAFFWFNWSNDIQKLVASEPQQSSVAITAHPIKPALEKCLSQRVGDVERMQEEGLITKAQYTSFRSRAESLCHAQNPS